MNSPRWRQSFAYLLLLALLLPVLAACGGTATAPTTESAATTAPAPAEPTVAEAEPTEEAPATEATMDTEMTMEPEMTEEATEEATTEATEDTDGAGTGGDDSTAVSPVGNYLRVNFGAEPDNIDPQKASFVNEIGFIMLNYLPLMTFNTDLEPVPGAAESFELSEDGQTFTFNLRPDMTYSDGEPLTAENFEYAWKRLCDPNVAGDYTSIAFPVVGCEEYYTAFDSGEVTVTDEAELQTLRDGVGVEAVDENTLTIQLKEPAPYFLNVAALWVGAPVREDLVEAGGETWWFDPVNYIGNGPFQLTEWEHQSRVRWERNESYVLDAPTFEAIEGVMITEANVAFEAYRADELDIGGVSSEDLATVQEDEELSAQYEQSSGSCTFYIGMNNAAPPFDNREVRQAFAQAIDRESLAQDLEQGLALPTQSFIPPGIPGYDESIDLWTFDAAAAKEKLDAAGFDYNQEIKYTFSSTALGRARAEYIAAMLQNNLGVTITLDPVDPTVYTSLFKKAAAERPQMFFLGWCADYPDPQNWLSLVFQTGGISADRLNFSNEQFDQLTQQADLLPVDDPERAELYKQAQVLLVEEAPVAFVYNDTVNSLTKPWVTGINRTPLDYFPGIFDLDSIQIRTE
jgi:oligopeptide transport system substrate-binding protein